MTTLEWLILLLVALLIVAVAVYVVSSLLDVGGGEAAELALELID